MKKFLAVYLGSPQPTGNPAWHTADEAGRKKLEKQGMAAWEQWGTVNQKAIVDHGAPLGKTKRIGPDGITDIRNQLAAFTIVQAESQEAAAKLFLNHPHFTIFPGDSVEIMECLPIPQP